MATCMHMKEANPSVQPKTPEGCEECLKRGSHWVELRMCLICGHVGCCDSSINRDATRHFKETGHPVMTEFPTKAWNWCYVDKDYTD